MVKCKCGKRMEFVRKYRKRNKYCCESCGNYIWKDIPKQDNVKTEGSYASKL